MSHYALVLLNKGGREVSRFPLRGGVNQVGAKSAGEGIVPEVDLSADDKQQVISRRHAILRVAPDRVTLADCGSTNGTRVDGTRITTVEVPVDERSSIMFGNLHAKLVRV
jgi:pSer/pThr/pTyr-binding forkhead associated (FHA) protein